MAGTVRASAVGSSGVFGGVECLTLLATADAADGSFPTTNLVPLGLEGVILAVVTNPGTTAPTDNYDITIVDGDGRDILGGAGANRDTANTEVAVPTGGHPFVARSDSATLTISNSSVNSATISIKVYYTRIVAAASASTSGSGTTTVTSLAATSATLSTVADSATSVTITASDATRKFVYIVNDSDQTLYLKFGSTATTSDFTVRLAPYEDVGIPASVYTGVIDGIWSANSTGSARVTVTAA